MAALREWLFQFHKGAIRTFFVVGLLSVYVDFNSIKVRLELRSTSGELRAPKFQFHKGAIRTLAPQRSFHSNFLFQFHKGAIRTLGRLLDRYCSLISIP